MISKQSFTERTAYGAQKRGNYRSCCRDIHGKEAALTSKPIVFFGKETEMRNPLNLLVTSSLSIQLF